MNKHRKMLEGVSEGPLYIKNHTSLYDVWDKNRRLFAQFASEENAEFVVYARNHAEDICDLIEAVEYFTVQWSEKPLLSGDIIGAVNKVKLALGKLNED